MCDIKARLNMASFHGSSFVRIRSREHGEWSVKCGAPQSTTTVDPFPKILETCYTLVIFPEQTKEKRMECVNECAIALFTFFIFLFFLVFYSCFITPHFLAILNTLTSSPYHLVSPTFYRSSIFSPLSTLPRPHQPRLIPL